MRLHLAGMPHTDLSDDYLSCAYTQKARKFIRMMEMRDIPLTVHWGTGRDEPGTMAWWPHEDLWAEFNEAVGEKISAEFDRDHDFLLLSGGRDQAALLDLGFITCEYGVGYEGVCAAFRVFESYPWMQYIYGKEAVRPWGDGRMFDAVIPNAIDPDDFTTGKPGDYFLYLGRIVNRKGVQVAIEATERIGAKLIVAGPTTAETVEGVYKPHVEMRGTVGAAERRELLAHARALFVPTLYIEPFGGVAVEAMASGCPVIATDWGAFTDTVEDGVDGFRCRMLADFADAAVMAFDLDRGRIRSRAVARFGLETVSRQYADYFDRLGTLRGEGWYA